MRKIWMRIGLSALFFVAVLALTGELHLSSLALRSFFIYWSLQTAFDLFQAWRGTRNARRVAGGEPPNSAAV